MEKLHISYEGIILEVFLNTPKKEKANQLITKIERLLLNCKVQKSEIYWKDKSMYEVELTQELDNQYSKELIFEVVEKISKISGSWNMMIPSDFCIEEYDISGVSEAPNLTGITWVSFMLQEQS